MTRYLSIPSHATAYITLTLCALLPLVSTAEEALSFDTSTFRWAIAPDATTSSFVDMVTTTDLVDTSGRQPFATWIDNAPRAAVGARREGDSLLVSFGEGREAVFNVTSHPRRIEFTLHELRGPVEGLKELHFARVPLKLTATTSDSFAVSLLALNLQTLVNEIPGYNQTINGAICFPELGTVGAAVALVGAPRAELREALKTAIAETSALPQSPRGGPWALEAEINYQSYFLDTSGRVNEESVDEWITMLNGLGIKQLDLHAGYAFRFGDYVPNPAVYPRGRESLKAVVDELHAAGIAAGLHTYAMFIAKDSPWVTPIPDPGLAKNAIFTLAADLADLDSIVPVEESTEKMSPLTGFHHRNSATIQIENELLVFKGVSKTAPFTFTECQRGAYGTVVSAHTKGAKVYHLKECFGLFAPDPDSELFHKVIAQTARTYNECGFDFMYMDALDGSDVIDLKGGGRFAWHYGAKFTWELFRQLKNPPLLEMSTFGHHLWVVRSRMGAWDACQRAPQTFADIHVLSNQTWQNNFLPTNLGWWGIFPWSGVQPKRSLAADVEYICAKALGTNSSLSFLLGFSPAEYPTSYRQQRLGEIINQYEKLRLGNMVPQAVREQLAEPGKAFHLDGETFRPATYHRKNFASDQTDPPWTVQNEHDEQTPGITIEALISTETINPAAARVIESYSAPSAMGEVQTQHGVQASFTVVAEPVKDAAASLAISATNTGGVEQTRAWAVMKRTFEPALDLRDQALGLWVHGDGKGALLNLQLRTPEHVGFAVTEHYIKVNFTGWRYCQLIESEDYAIEQYEWPYAKPRTDWQANLASAMAYAYPLYHAHLDYGQVGSIHIGVNDLPSGEEVKIFLGPIQTVPHKKAPLQNPKLTVNGDSLVFPISLDSGQILEYVPPRAFTVCDDKGELLQRGELNQAVPALRNGYNELSIHADLSPSHTSRARITLTTLGPPLTQ